MFEKFLITKHGHPGSVFSMMEIAVTLFYGGFVRFDDKKKSFKDKVLISKGHATSALYPILRDYGIISKKDWENWGKKKSNLRIFGNTSIPGIDITSGSLGHCIGAGAGMAVSYLNNNQDKKVYVVISEGELYEGSTWEALLFAKHRNLKNLTIIIDINNLIILGNTSDCLKLDPIKEKIEGLGINSVEVDGHNIDNLVLSLKECDESQQLNCILAKTTKGKGASIMENKQNWHYWNPMTKEQIEITRKDLE